MVGVETNQGGQPPKEATMRARIESSIVSLFFAASAMALPAGARAQCPEGYGSSGWHGPDGSRTECHSLPSEGMHFGSPEARTAFIALAGATVAMGVTGASLAVAGPIFAGKIISERVQNRKRNKELFAMVEDICKKEGLR